MRWWPVFVLGCLLGAVDAPGAGLRLLEEAWLDGPRWSRAETPPTGTFAWGAAGTGRRWNLPELPLAALGVAVGRRDGGGFWMARCSWQGLGGSACRVDRLVVEAARGGTWSVALRAATERLELGGETVPVPRELRVVLGRSWRNAAGWEAGCTLHLPLEDGSRADLRRVTRVLGASARLAPVRFTAVWDRRGDGTPLLGLEALVELSRAAAVAWRYDGGSRSVGWGLVLRRGPLLVRTSHLAHPDLGVSHRWQTVLGTGALPTVRMP